jgi:hypothetical protein
VPRRLSFRRRRTRPVDNYVPWMAIAAAASAPEPARRGSGRRPWLLALLVLVPIVVVALIVARSSDAHGHRRASAAGRQGTASGSGKRAAGTSGRRRSAAARASDPFTPALRQWLSHRDGDITAAVSNLQGTRTWLYRAGHPEHTASIVKVDILATLLHEHQSDGGLSAEDKELATGMIESSDDDDATDLWQAAGGAVAVQSFDDSVGMHQTTTNAAWGLTSTTPSDQLKLLRTVLFPGPLLDRASRDYEYGLMRSIIPYDTWGVTAGPQGHAKVAFKNGWLPDPVQWQVNSIGSVDGDGRHYLIAVMSSHNPTWDYGIDTIEHISRAAWHDLDGNS